MFEVLSNYGNRPGVKEAIFKSLVANSDALQAVAANGWDSDAEPIVLKALMGEKDQRYDDRLIQFLNPFGDRAGVKEVILQVFPANQDAAIKVIRDNHWDDDALPIAIESLNEATRKNFFTPSFFEFLKNQGDRPGVKEAILHALAVGPGGVDSALMIVNANHWESDAEPIILQATQTMRENHANSWYDLLGLFPDRPLVKEALVLAVLKTPSALDAITKNGWGKEVIQRLAKQLSHQTNSVENANQTQLYLSFLSTFPDQPGVKEVLLKFLPKNPMVIPFLEKDGWIEDAPKVLVRQFNGSENESIDNSVINLLVSHPNAPGVKQVIIKYVYTPLFAQAVLDNHWEADSLASVESYCTGISSNQEVPIELLRILDPFGDKPRVKALIFKLFAHTEGSLAIIKEHHWENEALIELENDFANNSDGGLDTELIDFISESSDSIKIKEALRPNLRTNPEAVNCIIKHGWVNEFKPDLMKLAQNGFSFPIQLKALALTGDPTTYPTLIDFVSHYNGDAAYFSDWMDPLRPLPGSLTLPVVAKFWPHARSSTGEYWFADMAVNWGLLSALDRSAELLAGTAINVRGDRRDLLSLARAVFYRATPCPVGLTDSEIAQWYTVHKTELTFDPPLNRFVFHAVASIDQGGPRILLEDYSKSLGHRAAKGDTTAIDQLQADVAQATDGLTPPMDQPKIDNIRNGIFGPAFLTIGEDSVSSPTGALAALAYANKIDAVKDYASFGYAGAAVEGNPDALALIKDWKRQGWSLQDVLYGMRPKLQQGSPIGVAFLLSLKDSPDVPGGLLRTDLDCLLEAANKGDKASAEAYEIIRVAK